MSGGCTAGRIRARLYSKINWKRPWMQSHHLTTHEAHFDLPKTVILLLLAIGESNNNYGFNAVEDSIDAVSVWWRCKRCNLLINLRGNTLPRELVARQTTHTNSNKDLTKLNDLTWLWTNELRCVLLPIFCSLCWLSRVLFECCQL